jgi:hypothetical protein
MAAIRYRDEQTRQHYLVDRDQVYKAKDDQVSLADRIADADAARLVAAREAYFSRHPDGLFGVVHDQLSPRGPLKTVPKGQFATLFEVTRRMNQAPRVTIDQLRWVFDGSLAHRH